MRVGRAAGNRNPPEPLPCRMSTRDPIPPLSLIFAYGPAFLILVLGIGGWLLPLPFQGMAVAAGYLWGTAILLFLAGVTRGLSFFTAGGPRPSQVAMFLFLFLLGFGALIAPMWIGLALLLPGYAGIALFDPPAARAGLAPGYFARLRPPQMAIIVAGLLLLLVRAIGG